MTLWEQSTLFNQFDHFICVVHRLPQIINTKSSTIMHKKKGANAPFLKCMFFLFNLCFLKTALRNKAVLQAMLRQPPNK